MAWKTLTKPCFLLTTTLCKCLYYWRTAVKTIIFIIIDTISINLTGRKRWFSSTLEVWYVNFLLLYRFYAGVNHQFLYSKACQASLTRLSDFLLDHKMKQYDDVWWCFNSTTSETNLLRFRQLVVLQKWKIYVFSSRACSSSWFSYPVSQSSTLATAIKKFMTYFLCLFHSLYFKMHVKQTPKRVIQ